MIYHIKYNLYSSIILKTDAVFRKRSTKLHKKEPLPRVVSILEIRAFLYKYFHSVLSGKRK